MKELMMHPAFQAGAAPFIIGLIAAILLFRGPKNRSGLAVIFGFLVTVYLVMGFSFEPLNSTRKIVLLGIFAALVGLILDALPFLKRVSLSALAIMGIAATLWLFWPLITNQPLGDILLPVALLALYTAWLLVAFGSMDKHPAMQGGAGLLALGIGTGISALIGASALYGQLGSAVAAAVGAFLLLHVFLEEETPTGFTVIVISVTICALIGVGAHKYAQLTWTALPLLASIPLVVRIPLPEYWSNSLRGLTWFALASLPAAMAIYLTWQSAGDMPF